MIFAFNLEQKKKRILFISWPQLCLVKREKYISINREVRMKNRMTKTDNLSIQSNSKMTPGGKSMGIPSAINYC